MYRVICEQTGESTHHETLELAKVCAKRMSKGDGCAYRINEDSIVIAIYRLGERTL